LTSITVHGQERAEGGGREGGVREERGRREGGRREGGGWEEGGRRITCAADSKSCRPFRTVWEEDEDFLVLFALLVRCPFDHSSNL